MSTRSLPILALLLAATQLATSSSNHSPQTTRGYWSRWGAQRSGNSWLYYGGETGRPRLPEKQVHDHRDHHHHHHQRPHHAPRPAEGGYKTGAAHAPTCSDDHPHARQSDFQHIPTRSSSPTLESSSSTPTLSTTMSPSALATTKPLGSRPEPYASIVIQQHNIHRANHSSQSISWSDDLALIALSIAKTCVWGHNVTAGGGGYGQNIAAGTTPINVGQVITNEFYDGEEPYFAHLYGKANPSFTNFEHWGHFSQVVWNASTEVGCATWQCKSLSGLPSDILPYFTVCNYKPPGNVGGEYADNIFKPLGHANVIVPPRSSQSNTKGH